MLKLANMTKIIVIGAGVSGIAAATKLLENGYQNLLVLEGENRIGGRVNTIPFASNVVDLGAQWCHGEKDNVVFQLANPHKLFDSATTKYDSFLCIKSNGEVVDQKIGDRLTELAISTVECYKDEIEKYQGPLGSFIVEKYEQLLSTPEYNDIDKNTAYQYLDFFHRYENSIEASDTWYDTSASGYLHYWDCDGDRLLNWKDRGFKTILDILMKKFPDTSKSLNVEDKILFNKTVSNIEWSRSDGFVNVRCTDGSSYLANHVISTVSLGVLKERYLSLFSPELPQLKVNAIQGLGIGTVNKIFLEFEKPFWTSDWQGFSLLWEQEDIKEVQKRVSWLQDVFGFYIVDYQPNILCGWISGHSARHMEMSSDEEVKEGVMYLLRKFLKKSFNNVPDPIRIQRTNWYSNEHFRGSYSFRSIATDLLKTSAADLAKPLVNSLGIPTLQFAGEATHDHYYSTVHGALESGWREAGRIIDLYKSTEKPKLLQEIDINLTQIIDELDVLILGGGLAGLGAAHTLSTSSNLKFFILEANEIPGGRILTGKMYNPKVINSKNDPKTSVNAGAQWLHGRENPLYELANKNKLLSQTLSEEGLGAYIRSDGTRINEFLVKKVDFIIGQILEDCEEFAQNPSKPYSSSVGAHLLSEFETRLSQFETTSEKILAKQLFDWHIRFQIIDNSCLTIDDVSAKNWGTYSFNGESCQAHINFNDTFYDIIDVLTQEIGPEKIKCGYKVQKICWGVNQSEPPSNTPKVLVSCENGKIFIAKHVICTFSLGVLKRCIDSEIDMFQPQLPNLYQNVIKSMGFGTIDKIFMQFETPWWGNDNGFQLIYEDLNYENADWTRMISGFDLLSPGPLNTLLGWIGGRGAIEMEKFSDEQIIDKLLQLLEKFVKTHVPKPINYYVTRWYTNENIRGAYSYCSKQCDKNNYSPKQLAMPIFYKDLNTIERPISVNDVDEHLNDSPLILFAGEACHEQYYSTAHGAYLSGGDQAKKILRYYSIKDK